MQDRDLEPYLRGRVWWVKGHRPDTGRYIRESLGTSDEALAEAKVEEIYRAARNRRILGPDAPKPEDELTVANCVLIYHTSRRDATYLARIVKRIGRLRVRDATPTFIRNLAREMMPYASTDTWQREIVTPLRSAINHAHELGKCPPIRIRRFSEAEMVKQDVFRGKQSRVPKVPGSWPWVLAFMAAAEPRDAALAYFMFRHGYRITQSIAMTRSKDMDLSAGRVRVHASKGHAAHWVDLDPSEVAAIANLPVPYRGEAMDRVFTIAGGRSGALYRRWRETCTRAGIAYLAPHAAGRHGYGTEMVVRHGINAVDAAKNKWADPNVLLKTYSHAESSEDKVREAFMAGLEVARTPAVQPNSWKQAKRMKGRAK